MAGHIAADINFPSQLTHIADPMDPCEAHADLDFLHSAKRVGGVAKVIGRHRLHQGPRIWPHYGQNAFGCGYIGDHHIMLAHVAAQPGFIREASCGWRDHQIGGFRKPRNRDVSFNAGGSV